MKPESNKLGKELAQEIIERFKSTIQELVDVRKKLKRWLDEDKWKSDDYILNFDKGFTAYASLVETERKLWKQLYDIVTKHQDDSDVMKSFSKMVNELTRETIDADETLKLIKEKLGLPINLGGNEK